MIRYFIDDVESSSDDTSEEQMLFDKYVSWLLFGPASARSHKIGVVGNWLVGWLVGNAVFSETAPRIFLIFCMKLCDYKGRKVTEPDF